MQITNIRTRLLSVPFDRPITTATFSVNHKDIVVIEVDTDAGITGMSYIMTLGRGIHALKAVIDYEIRSLVIDEDPLYRQKIWKKLWWGLHKIGRKGAAIYAISAIDVALWDIAGKMTNQSIHQMLGPACDSIEAYGGGGWLYMSIDDMLEEVNTFKQKFGFKAYKMRAGSTNWRQDVDRIRALREAFGYDLEIMVDLNQGLDVPSSIILGRELEKLGVFWFEEPIHADDIGGLSDIAATLDMRVVAGENEYGRYGYKDLINRKAADILQIDLQRVGGITEWMRVANTADTMGIKVTPHLFWEISVQLTCATTNSIYIEYMDWLDNCFEELPEIKGGHIHAWKKPGHGLKFRDEIMKNYEIK
ncbi:MAG: mandelate racemase/muconate lactonizing enzyme family protein [Negativicutes bacterium]|nr:mandelate racemase/muconate lactonizing enzyme family protein [Negativicutes bacterium]